jgi:hypothetical protein
VILNQLFEQILTINVECNALSVRLLASNLLGTFDRHIGCNYVNNIRSLKFPLTHTNSDQVSGHTAQVLDARLGDETSTQHQDLLVTVTDTN